MSKLRVEIPHQLGRAGARQRVQEAVAELERRHGTLLNKVDAYWNQDALRFTVGAMGVAVSGDLFVEEHQVRVEVELPWFLARLGGLIKGRIEQQGRILLGQRRPGPGQPP